MSEERPTSDAAQGDAARKAPYEAPYETHATDSDAWAKACAEDLEAEKARRRARYGPPPGSAAEELRKLVDAGIERPLHHRDGQRVTGHLEAAGVCRLNDCGTNVRGRHRAAARFQRELDDVDLGGEAFDEARGLRDVVDVRREAIAAPRRRRIATR